MILFLLLKLVKMIYIGTIRYNTQTYNEILDWKKRKNWKGCIYGINKELSTKKMYNNGSFPINSYIYVIEMDNDNNKIFGIGRILFKYEDVKRTFIHSDENLNRFHFKSHYHKNRQELVKINVTVVNYLENLLFKGSRHLKRGQGITRLYNNRIMTFIPEKERKVYKCSICGLPKKGHICPNKRVKPLDKKIHNCKYCGKALKTNGGLGHICVKYEQSKMILDYVMLFLENLF